MLKKPFFEQTVLKEYYSRNLGHRELIKTLYDEWIETQKQEIFLILYMQVWLCLEDVYMENTSNYYSENSYEKILFFKLVSYGKRNLNKNIKFLLLTGYIYSTTSYYFLADTRYSSEEIEKAGEKIISDLYFKHSKSLMVYCFYILVTATKKKEMRFEKNERGSLQIISFRYRS